MEEDGRHADGRHRRNSVAVVLKHGIREQALQAMRHAVTDAEAFGYDGGQVGKLFELLPFR